MNAATVCDRCAKDCTPEAGSIGTGYGVTTEGAKHCYQCCGETERAEMIETGRACLYLVKRADGWHLTTWPGTLDIRAHYVTTGRHNWAGVRYDARFTGPDGAKWRSTTYGDNSQIARCYRLKKQPR